MVNPKNAGKYSTEKTVFRATCSTVFSPARIEAAVPWTELMARMV
eukprot:CAMPEP_0113617396 /NCGR_PEP_ID=MMETSP0017_2-20120614/8759_1 /TAXON_ID=2856 /ORGANISM="Cylindrotheca closterium" /LENGTH=44 /DNA_ID=CAMNT_0000526791 /DNA_START=407 /DNA_END=541 /DNA_ORIENTATION=+ /assembly_acc=CAM_ASM_000147